MNTNRPAPRLRHLASAALALALAAGALAQRNISVSASSVERLIEQLGDASFAEREDAMRKLMTSDLPIERILEAAQPVMRLSPEQYIRLERVLETRFRESPRGAIGVRFDGKPNELGVRLQEIVPGFPAADQLQGGDILTIVDNVDLRRADSPTVYQLPHIILSHDPGEMLSVSLLRDNQQLNLRIPLGDYGEFSRTDNAAASPEVISGAWELRRKRMGFDHSIIQPIRVAARNTSWLSAATGRPDESKVGFVAGASSRAVAERAFQVFAPEENWARREIDAPKAPPLPKLAASEIDRRLEIVQLQRELSSEITQQRALADVLNDKNATPERRLEARRRLEESRDRMAIIRLRIDALQKAEEARSK